MSKIADGYGGELGTHTITQSGLDAVATASKRFAERHLHPERLTTVAVGPIRAEDVQL